MLCIIYKELSKPISLTDVLLQDIKTSNFIMTMMFYFLMLKQYQHSFIHLSFLINCKKKKQSQLSITHTNSKHYLSLLPIMQREINEFFLLLITNQIYLLWSKNIYLWSFPPPEKIIWNHACDKMDIIDWEKFFFWDSEFHIMI